MRIVYVINDLGGGGAERVATTAAAALGQRGHDAQIVALSPVQAYPVAAPVTVIAKTIPTGFFAARAAARKLRRIVRPDPQAGRRGADLVVASLSGADRVVRAAGLPNSWHWIHNTLSVQAAAQASRPASAGEVTRGLARLRRRYDGRRLIAVSHGVAADLRDTVGCTSADIRAIFNPFDLADIRRLALTPSADVPPFPFVIHAGRFSAQKRHDLLLDAYKAAGISHRLVLLTEQRPDLAALIAERGLGDRVVVAGFQANPFAWYAKAAALVLSSDFEGLSNVIVEALACGTPVVSTDCPSGPAEIMTGTLARYLAPVGDTAALAALIREVTTVRPSIPADIVDRFALDRYVAAIEGLAADAASPRPAAMGGRA